MTVFDLTCAQSRHANRSACHSVGRRLAFGHDAGDRVTATARAPRSPCRGSARARHRRSSESRDPRTLVTSASAGTRSGTTTRMLALVARIARASSSTDGRDHGVDARGDDRAGGLDVDRAIEGDRGPKGRQRIGLAGAHVRIGGARAGRGAARVGVLDERRGRFRELDHHPDRGIEIEQVRVRQLLALKDRVAGMRSEARRRARRADAGSRRSGDREPCADRSPALSGNASCGVDA